MKFSPYNVWQHYQSQLSDKGTKKLGVLWPSCRLPQSSLGLQSLSMILCPHPYQHQKELDKATTSWLVFFCCCCSVAKLCPILCDPMDRIRPGFCVLHYLPEFPSNSCPLSWWCHPTISSSVALFSSCPQPFTASGSFPMSRLFGLGGQSIGASASASVPPVNIQSGLPLGSTGWFPYYPRVFSSTTV